MDDREALARQAWAAISDVFFSAAMHDRFHDATHAAGLPHPGALKALMGLDPDDPPSMRQIADDMRCDASYVTALVDALEDNGYVERHVSQSDRRVKLVRLTPAGERARAVAHEVIATPPSVLERLTDDEIRALARIAGKLVEGD